MIRQIRLLLGNQPENFLVLGHDHVPLQGGEEAQVPHPIKMGIHLLHQVPGSDLTAPEKQNFVKLIVQLVQTRIIPLFVANLLHL